jgi:hypothetical protein
MTLDILEERVYVMCRSVVVVVHDSRPLDVVPGHLGAEDHRDLYLDGGRVYVFKVYISKASNQMAIACSHIPMKVVGPWEFMLSVGTERTNVARAFVNKTVTYHFVLPLEAFSAFCSRSTVDRTVMWSK